MKIMQKDVERAAKMGPHLYTGLRAVGHRSYQTSKCFSCFLDLWISRIDKTVTGHFNFQKILAAKVRSCLGGGSRLQTSIATNIRGEYTPPCFGEGEGRRRRKGGASHSLLVSRHGNCFTVIDTMSSITNISPLP